MTDTKYHGWTNRATWNVHLWLMNDEPMYRATMVEVTQNRTLKALTARLEAFCRELWPNGRTPDDDPLSEVNWKEVAKALRE